MSFFENTRKPVGFGGKIMVAMMNSGHGAKLYESVELETVESMACFTCKKGEKR